MSISDDISRCNPTNCEVKQDCLRYTSPIQQFGSITDFSGSCVIGEICDYMIVAKGEK